MTAPAGPVRFGTDGIRGPSGAPPLDPETLGKIGAALGIWLEGEGPERKQVLLGDDGRSSAGTIRTALARGLAATETIIVDVGLITTPALAHLVRTGRFTAGIMISASHNPATDNGIKFFNANGAKLSDESEQELEQLIPSMELAGAGEPPIHTRPELVGGYEDYLGNLFMDLDLTGMNIVVDAANGSGSDLAPRILRRFGAEVVTTGCTPDGSNINDGVGALHPQSIIELVREHKAILGICLDGDGDRGIFVDDSGVVRDGDETMLVMALALKAKGMLAKDTVVATIMSNLGLVKACEKHGLHMEITPVGDRHVAEAMRNHGFNLGGEQSGHIIFSSDGALTGDGLFTALQLLSLPSIREHGSARLFDGFTRYPQVLINVEIASKPDLETLEPVRTAVSDSEKKLAGDGRIVLRYSGTENLCRIMIEGPEEDVIRMHAQTIANAVRHEIGA